MENNMPTWAVVVIGILSAIGGGFGSTIISALKEFFTGRKEAKKAETEQAIQIYKDIIESLKSDVSEIKKNIDILSKEHLSCREENASMKIQIQFLNKKILEMEDKIAVYEGKIQSSRSGSTPS